MPLNPSALKAEKPERGQESVLDFCTDLAVHGRRTAVVQSCVTEHLQPEFNPQIQVPPTYIIPDLYQLRENSVQNKKKNRAF